jgi:hypothetical protein
LHNNLETSSNSQHEPFQFPDMPQSPRVKSTRRVGRRREYNPVNQALISLGMSAVTFWFAYYLFGDKLTAILHQVPDKVLADRVVAQKSPSNPVLPNSKSPTIPRPQPNLRVQLDRARQYLASNDSPNALRMLSDSKRNPAWQENSELRGEYQRLFEIATLIQWAGEGLPKLRQLINASDKLIIAGEEITVTRTSGACIRLERSDHWVELEGTALPSDVVVAIVDLVAHNNGKWLAAAGAIAAMDGRMDRSVARQLFRRAERAGYDTLLLLPELDCPLPSALIPSPRLLENSPFFLSLSSSASRENAAELSKEANSPIEETMLDEANPAGQLADVDLHRFPHGKLSNLFADMRTVYVKTFDGITFLHQTLGDGFKKSSFSGPCIAFYKSENGRQIPFYLGRYQTGKRTGDWYVWNKDFKRLASFQYGPQEKVRGTLALFEADKPEYFQQWEAGQVKSQNSITNSNDSNARQVTELLNRIDTLENVTEKAFDQFVQQLKNEKNAEMRAAALHRQQQEAQAQQQAFKLFMVGVNRAVPGANALNQKIIPQVPIGIPQRPEGGVPIGTPQRPENGTPIGTPQRPDN